MRNVRKISFERVHSGLVRCGHMQACLPFNEWPEIFGSERLTGALLDRIANHVHILEMNADSYRLQQGRRNRP